MSKTGRIVQLEPQHLRDLDADRLRFDLGSTPPDQIELLISVGPSRAVIYNEKVIVCAGIIPQWYGNARVWSLVTVGPGFRPLIAATRLAIDFFDDLQTDDQYERLEFTVEDDYPQGHGWAKRLGFTKECVMERYRKGVDHALYRRFLDG